MTNLDKLEKIFPECITEALDADGKICRAVNFERLKQILSGERAAGKEAYEFNFVGKKNAELEAHRPTDKTLRPVLDESRDFNATENLYVEGDNLEALKILEESYLGKVKMIYIDPPYNTGNDFIYRDNFAQNADDFDAAAGNLDADGNLLNLQLNRESHGRFHSDWCAMIFSRLLLAKNFLSDDGVIFISIDYNENYNLRAICNEVFGGSSFVGEIYWESKTKSQNTITAYDKLQPKVEMILVYSPNPKVRFNLLKVGEKKYPFEDQKGSYREHALEFMNSRGIRGRESMIFDITIDGKTVSPPPGKQWQIGIEQVEKYKADGELFERDGKIFLKMRPQYERVVRTEPFWGFFSKEIGTAESAKKELSALLQRNVFETVKPVELIKRLIFHATGEDSIVMDFFSGSATTAHAVMELNATDGGHRKFIMIQIGDATPANSEARRAGYEKISDIGKERIRRAGDKLKAEHPALDTGFRVFKVSTSNFKPLPTDLQTLLTFVDNIEPDRNEYDLFFGTLLSKGMTLDKKFAAEEVDGFKVLSADGGEILACFDEKILAATFRKLAERKPRKIFFRDSSFASSADKINALEFIKNFAPDTEVTVL